MNVSDVVLWVYAAASFVPFLMTLRNRSVKKQLVKVRFEVALAVLALPVGTFSEFLWLYFIVAGLWTLNAFLSVGLLRRMEENERLAAEHAALLRKLTEK